MKDLGFSFWHLHENRLLISSSKIWNRIAVSINPYTFGFQVTFFFHRVKVLFLMCLFIQLQENNQ